ncbi:MAG: periplasmic heavy metal sensor [Steroidobacteraceae bacterium]
MKSFSMLATGLLLLILMISASARAAEQGDKDEWIKGKLFGPELILKHQSKLKLTEKQRDMIGAELKRVQAQAAESDWLLMTEASQLQELIAQHPVDGKAVLKGVDRVFEAENRKKRLFVEMLINIKNALTPEQVAYLKSVSE